MSVRATIYIQRIGLQKALRIRHPVPHCERFPGRGQFEEGALTRILSAQFDIVNVALRPPGIIYVQLDGVFRTEYFFARGIVPFNSELDRSGFAQ